MKGAVLVVDNVPESQEAASALLAAEGYEVSTAVDAETALKAIVQRLPSAVLFRILDPANGVIGFVRRLALSRHVMSVPVVVVTALNEFQVDSFLNGVPGVRRVVHSPCPPEAELAAVAQAVRYPKP